MTMVMVVIIVSIFVLCYNTDLCVLKNEYQELAQNITDDKWSDSLCTLKNNKQWKNTMVLVIFWKRFEMVL